MPETFLRRTPIRLLLLGLLLFLVAGAVPPFVIGQMRPIDIGMSEVLRTRPAPTMVHGAPFADGTPPLENQDRPECRGVDPAELPTSCFMVIRDAQQTLTLTTSRAPKKSEVNVDVLTQVAIDGRIGAEIHDSLRLDRRSSYPVSDPVSHLVLSLPERGSGVTSEDFVREGLQYFFPMPTSRQSYAWYDTSVRRPLWLDFVGETEHNGLDTYEFHHTVTALDLNEATSPDLELREEEQGALEKIAGEGLGTPWYAVRRTVWVEPQSGTIVDVHVEPHLYFAPDTAEAEARAFDLSPGHTIYHTTLAWDDDTLARVHDRAQGSVVQLRVLQVFAVLTKALALVVALVGVVLLLRERRDRP
ncbi:porin PorA family protein [Corynebacterium sp.]|uniref:porin PorA family protein n=1 Tax=Corynebacterium sp. TaxID=1720 RepID=UPI0019C1C433|nr:porin PorA family protein [Corynebacterium sp.]HHU67577.1 DUF3068 domain-containing protein [Corynebacterium sp.]